VERLLCVSVNTVLLIANIINSSKTAFNYENKTFVSTTNKPKLIGGLGSTQTVLPNVMKGLELISSVDNYALINSV